MDQNDAFKKLHKTVDHEVEKLRQQAQELRNELRLERDRHQKLQEELSQQKKRLILDCKICYMQPDCWLTMLCGHMVCESCAGKLDPKVCPFCRASFSGYVKCYPFAG